MQFGSVAVGLLADADRPSADCSERNFLAGKPARFSTPVIDGLGVCRVVRSGLEPVLNRLAMKVHLVLHVLDGDHLLFSGPPNKCPPGPRVGEEIVHSQQRHKLEGISYSYENGLVVIALLA